ncbi:ribonuclease III [Sphingopyxis macrogoltabida]|uniref:Ribonuclease 3 n=1 Tax=Sphingopyxis macrogoltabida TaxID=33050 RepID=A0AAC8Z0Q8_SPHMC|nr:ribonuclease III [Sphingopyxis macrogoltabida]ALJ12795.1 ribonuclease III [Sphingopyxis macrogoltabida]AMU89738.1 ribonuclease III [Sphingopyxis macrogoltabida]
MNDTLDTGALADIIGRAPGNLALYDQALTHGSTGRADYQRLEFLGDRVLGLVIASELYTRFPAATEGELSSRLHALASGETCAAIARRLDLTALVRFGAQARSDGGRYSDNIAADAIEALIGALYLDQGADAARAFILAHWGAMIEGQQAAPKHPKAALQEWALARKRRPPEYEIVAREGPDHAPRFRVAVSVGKLARAEAEGASKQAAEKAAAAALLAELEGQEK